MTHTMKTLVNVCLGGGGILSGHPVLFSMKAYIASLMKNELGSTHIVSKRVPSIKRRINKLPPKIGKNKFKIPTINPNSCNKKSYIQVIVGFRNPKSVYTSCFHAIDGISDTGIFSERISKEDFMAAILTGDSRNSNDLKVK
ncbi:unnamed protein product [Owenia fusiformis]|uniref:Uncharacterized protein n=1 Tax=Owenia fusiformis TaxID=6347 RepID=A0A8S4Q4A1_OWEFU|nr:unnamed protein product [Owenia fusiformis]